MKIAVLGGGIAGLTAAYDLSKRGHRVTLFEKAPALGGLASGFINNGWDWPLERAYHHLFTNDYDILRFAKEIGFDGMYVTTPQTTSLFEQTDGTLKLYPFDSPQHLLAFPLLSPLDRVRTAAILGFFKLSPYFSAYERISTEKFLRTTMGNTVWNVLWQGLFRKKFGKYAGNILLSFFWSRIKKRTKNLVYIQGGFQTFIDHLEKKLKENGVDLQIGTGVEKIESRGEKFGINGTDYDCVVSTLPTPILVKVGEGVLPVSYIGRLSRLRYLHATNLIIESKEPFLDTAYWVNVIPETIPITVIIQHTNLVDKKHYGNKHVLYVGNYVDADSPLLKMNKDEALKFFLPYLKLITSHQSPVTSYWYFKGPYAQPIFDKTFLKNKPDFITPVKNFYIANLDMTYPHDRGTNYAVKLGREVAKLI